MARFSALALLLVLSLFSSALCFVPAASNAVRLGSVALEVRCLSPPPARPVNFNSTNVRIPTARYRPAPTLRFDRRTT